MRKLMISTALALCFLGSSANGQQLPPFGVPLPQIPNPGDPQSMKTCTPTRDALLKEQLTQLEKLRATAAQDILVICDGVKEVEKLLEGVAIALKKDKDALKQQFEAYVRDMMKPLGIPHVDFRFVEHLCVQGAGEIQRTIITEIGRIKSEQLRCGSI